MITRFSNCTAYPISSGRMGFCQLRPAVQSINLKDTFPSSVSSVTGWKAPPAPASTFQFWQLRLPPETAGWARERERPCVSEGNCICNIMSCLIAYPSLHAFAWVIMRHLKVLLELCSLLPKIGLATEQVNFNILKDLFQKGEKLSAMISISI